MEPLTESLLILVTTPVYVFLIRSELLLSYLHDRHYYSFRGTLINIYLSSLSFGFDIALRVTSFAMLSYVFRFHLRIATNPWVYWISLLVLQDFAFYFLHRLEHGCRLLWAVHVTHHFSEEFNLTVGIRSSVFQPL
jgi:sterol desaturase/sphingolipid hydroxylase (fatty acid hydroxylase superfamily)